MQAFTAFAFLFLGYLFQAILPDGWIYPKDPLFFREWREKSPDKYLSCRADFNGDNKPDTAYILEADKDDNYGIFVKISGASDNKLICIHDAAKIINEWYATHTLSPIEKSQIGNNNSIKSDVINLGIRVLPPGIYKTACGKGYWDCAKTETEEIELKHPAIDFFEYDAGFQLIYYWNIEKKMFMEIPLGD